ncbi:MAG: hypothetical protein IKN57_02005, partial [Parasporobacterium sp.]|nr:hypothetical protein [Parasporobacterium sp.]
MNKGKAGGRMAANFIYISDYRRNDAGYKSEEECLNLVKGNQQKMHSEDHKKKYRQHGERAAEGKIQAGGQAAKKGP